MNTCLDLSWSFITIFFYFKLSTTKSGDLRAVLEGVAASAGGGCVQSTENRYSFIHSFIRLTVFLLLIYFDPNPNTVYISSIAHEKKTERLGIIYVTKFNKRKNALELVSTKAQRI